MRLFLLGPSRWRAAAPPSSSVASHAETTPLGIRRMLARAARARGVDAAVMEDVRQRPDESHSALFARILDHDEAVRVVILWPAHSVRVGLDIELGMLLARAIDGQEIDIVVFLEAGAGSVEQGRFTSREKGVRSRYYEDLIQLGADLVVWHDLEDLSRRFVRLVM